MLKYLISKKIGEGFMGNKDLWLEMMEQQKVLDSVILNAKNLVSKDILKERSLALLVEFTEYKEAEMLMEMACEGTLEECLKNLNEERADIVHFLLMLIYTFYETVEEFGKDYAEIEVWDVAPFEMDHAHIYAGKAVNNLKKIWKYWSEKEPDFQEVKKNLILSLKCLEETTGVKEIYEEYQKKNKINLERIESGTY